jgi:TolB-like protein/DNA-binding winged helix-turn-helix (wHTH) protein/Tfp pilus assembly protein PilF
LPDTVYEFAEFRLDCGRFELLRKSQPLRIERKPMELLILLVSREGQLVSRSEIAERLWSSEVFVDTEHGINTAVRKLRQTLRDEPAGPKFIQTVTGVGYRFIAPVLIESQVVRPQVPELPEAERALSEVVRLDATGEPLAPNEPPLPDVVSARKDPPARTQGHRALWLTAAAALMMLTVSLVRHRLSDAPAPNLKSLAVLPLDNVSGDTGQEYLAAGMTDELTTMIARNSTLRITSRTSVMQYKGVHRPLPEIARALGVDGIVEGSVAHEGNRLHVTLQLIRADTDSHIWAQSFDRATSDTGLAEEAAQEIAKQLHSVTPVTTRRSINPEAHDAYLRGRYLWMSQDMKDSGAYFRRATEIQPDYADAWAGLADYYGEGAAGDVLDPRTAFGPEEEAAKRALELDPDSAEAHAAIAAVYLIVRWDFTNADIESQQAIRLDPRNGGLYYFRACVLEAMDRDDEAIEAAKRSVELAPYERSFGIAEMYGLGRQYDAALADLRLRLEAQPNNGDLLGFQSDISRRKGDYKEALNAWQRMIVASGLAEDSRVGRQVYDKGGWSGFVRWQLHLLERQAKSQYVSPVQLALYHAQLGEREPTLALLEEGYRQRATDMLWIHQDPAYDFLNAEPRFRSILKRMGEPAGK